MRDESGRTFATRHDRHFTDFILSRYRVGRQTRHFARTLPRKDAWTRSVDTTRSLSMVACGGQKAWSGCDARGLEPFGIAARRFGSSRTGRSVRGR